MTCQEFDSLLDAFVNNALPAIDASAMEAHMNDCPACKIDYAFALKTKKALHSFPVIEVPDDFLANINKRIDEEVANLYTPKFNFNVLLNKKVYPAIAACLAFALLIGTKPWSLIRDSGTDVDAPVSTFAPIDKTAKPKKADSPIMDFAKANDATPSEAPVIDAQVPQAVAPTVKPQAPTAMPTVKPTAKPVAQPTNRPTTAPVATAITPVVAPTQEPIVDTTPAETVIPTQTQVPVETNSIALPSEHYIVSDESDNANYAKIKAKSKLEQSYALADSFDGTLFTPDVLAQISQYDNIVVDDPLLISENDVFTALTVSPDDMDSVNKALDVFRFKSNGNKYLISKDELKKFLNTLDNLGVEYTFDHDSIKGDTIIELITA